MLMCDGAGADGGGRAGVSFAALEPAQAPCCVLGHSVSKLPEIACGVEAQPLAQRAS